MDWSLALAPFLLSIVLIYFLLFQFLNYLFRRHPIWFLATIILMAPYGLVLVQVSNALELAWVLILTPFYGVIVVSLVATTWVVRFYSSAFAALLTLEFLFQRRKGLACASKDVLDFNLFWRRHFSTPFSRTKRQTRIERAFRESGSAFSKGVSKYWTIVASVVLVIMATSTLVNSSMLKDPTYGQAVRFVASDTTDKHPYIDGEYVCTNFAEDFQANAKKAGFNCGYVIVLLTDLSTHALNCFNTTDHGTIYVEPQKDKIVQLEVGQVYSGLPGNLAEKNVTVLGFYVK